MKKKFSSIVFLISFLLLIPIDGIFSQNNNIYDFNFYNPQTKVYVFGEFHYKKMNLSFQKEVLRYLDSCTEKDIHIFIELPYALSEISNAYVNSKEETNHSIFEKLKERKRYYKVTFELLNTIREFISNRRDENSRVSLSCFNIFLFPKFDFYFEIELLSMIYPSINEFIDEEMRAILISKPKDVNIKRSFYSKLYDAHKRKYPINIDTPKTNSALLALMEIEKSCLQFKHGILSSQFREALMSTYIHRRMSKDNLNVIFTGIDHSVEDEIIQFEDWTQKGRFFSSMTALLSKAIFENPNYRLSEKDESDFILTFGMSYHSKRKYNDELKKRNIQKDRNPCFFIYKIPENIEPTNEYDYFDYQVFLRK